MDLPPPLSSYFSPPETTEKILAVFVNLLSSSKFCSNRHLSQEGKSKTSFKTFHPLYCSLLHHLSTFIFGETKPEEGERKEGEKRWTGGGPSIVATSLLVRVALSSPDDVFLELLAWGGGGEEDGDDVCAKRLLEWKEKENEEEKKKEMILEWKPRLVSLRRGIEKDEFVSLRKEKKWVPW
uniref:Uncharacterized protein n=1 Tax=Paramoeba aestuarina TaxID=180227 RepID=A0A7S4L8W4_9EUKA